MPISTSATGGTSTTSKEEEEEEERLGGNTGETNRWNWKRTLMAFVRRDDNSDAAQQPILVPALAITNSSLSSSSSPSFSSDSTDSDSSGTTNGTTPSRNPNFPPFSSESQSNTTYTQLLPCLEICNALERACPPFLALACPVPQFDASRSYGVGYVDGDSPTSSDADSNSDSNQNDGASSKDSGSGMTLRSDGMGSDGNGGTWAPGGGVTGVSQDRYGNVWCNGNVRGLVQELG